MKIIIKMDYAYNEVSEYTIDTEEKNIALSKGIRDYELKMENKIIELIGKIKDIKIDGQKITIINEKNEITEFVLNNENYITSFRCDSIDRIDDVYHPFYSKSLEEIYLPNITVVTADRFMVDSPKLKRFIAPKLRYIGGNQFLDYTIICSKNDKKVDDDDDYCWGFNHHPIYDMEELEFSRDVVVAKFCYNNGYLKYLVKCAKKITPKDSKTLKIRLAEMEYEKTILSHIPNGINPICPTVVNNGQIIPHASHCLNFPDNIICNTNIQITMEPSYKEQYHHIENWVQLNKERYIVFDRYVLDLKEKKITQYYEGKLLNGYPYGVDTFIDSVSPIKEVDVKNIENGRKITITRDDGVKTILTLNELNQVIGYENKNLELMDNNNSLITFSIATVPDWIISYGNDMKCNRPLLGSTTLKRIIIPNVAFKNNGISFRFCIANQKQLEYLEVKRDLVGLNYRFINGRFPALYFALKEAEKIVSPSEQSIKMKIKYLENVKQRLSNGLYVAMDNLEYEILNSEKPTKSIATEIHEMIDINCKENEETLKRLGLTKR